MSWIKSSSINVSVNVEHVRFIDVFPVDKENDVYELSANFDSQQAVSLFLGTLTECKELLRVIDKTLGVLSLE